MMMWSAKHSENVLASTQVCKSFFFVFSGYNSQENFFLELTGLLFVSKNMFSLLHISGQKVFIHLQ